MKQRITDALADREFLGRLFQVAMPIALQSLMVTSLNLIDTIMIGQLGETQIAAVALGNQIYFLLMLFLFGVGSGTAVFTAQYWGRKDVPGIRSSVGVSLLFVAAGGSFFTAAAVFFPEHVLRFYTTDNAVITLGSSYLRIVGLSYLCTGLSVTFSTVLRSTNNVRLPLVGTSIALALNTAFNYLLIFGKLGFPALGVEGAAIATACARLVEATIIVGVSYLRREAVAGRLGEFFRFSRKFLGRFIRTALPVVFNEIGWSLGITMYAAVYARMGTSVLAAYNIADTVSRMAFVVFVGTGNAAAIIIGNRIGAGEGHLASRYARQILTIVPLLGLVAGGIVLSLSPLVPLLFAVSADVRSMVSAIMRVFSLIIIAKVTNLHIIVGLLRSGGDTRYSLLVDVATLWFVGLPLVFVAGLVLHLPVHVVYLCTAGEELAKLALGLPRIVSGRWIHNVTAGD